jgi:hypothetical protein
MTKGDTHMKNRLVGLGLGLSLLAGCGADSNPEVRNDVSQTQTVEKAEDEQKISCMDDDRYSGRPINSSRFVIKSCEFIGQTEFYNDTDSIEAEIVVMVFEDIISSRALECILIHNGNSRAGIQSDCNWPAYNEQG